MYRDKTFRVRALEETLEDIERAGAAVGDDVEKLFVAHGDALVLPLDHWLPILSRAPGDDPTLKKIAKGDDAKKHVEAAARAQRPAWASARSRSLASRWTEATSTRGRRPSRLRSLVMR